MVVAYAAGVVPCGSVGIGEGVGVFFIGSFVICAGEEFTVWATPLVNATEDRSPFDIMGVVFSGIVLFCSYSANQLVFPLTEIVLPL